MRTKTFILGDRPDIPNFELWQKGYRLSMAVHRLVNVFPSQMRHSIGSELKHSANRALVKIACSKFNLAHDKILETLSNLEVARGLRLAKDINFQILVQEYQKLAEDIISVSPRLSLGSYRGSASVKEKNKEIRRQKLNPRQKKIIQHLKENKKIAFNQLHQIFSDVSPRTIRLDLKNLLAQKVIHKNGKSVGTHYTL